MGTDERAQPCSPSNPPEPGGQIMALAARANRCRRSIRSERPILATAGGRVEAVFIGANKLICCNALMSLLAHICAKPMERDVRSWRKRTMGGGRGMPVMSSRAEELHLRALPEPYVNLSIHTAPDVRPLP